MRMGCVVTSPTLPARRHPRCWCPGEENARDARGMRGRLSVGGLHSAARASGSADEFAVGRSGDRAPGASPARRRCITRSNSLRWRRSRSLRAILPDISLPSFSFQFFPLYMGVNRRIQGYMPRGALRSAMVRAGRARDPSARRRRRQELRALLPVDEAVVEGHRQLGDPARLDPLVVAATRPPTASGAPRRTRRCRPRPGSGSACRCRRRTRRRW